MRLEGKFALVTGGLRGIGKAIVERFVEEGARVFVVDLDDEAPEIDASDVVFYDQMNVTDNAGWIAVLAEIGRRFGRLDILINNAGASRTGTIASASEADWRTMMDINALSVFLGCQHAVAEMAERGGVIINIASARGLRAGSTQCAYSASKAAVLSLTQSVALHCGETGLPIRCNAICPGVIDTPLLRQHVESLGAPGALKGLAERQIVGRLGAAKEVADAALFLASDEASFITGAALSVDGGFVIRDR